MCNYVSDDWATSSEVCEQFGRFHGLVKHSLCRLMGHGYIPFSCSLYEHLINNIQRYRGNFFSLVSPDIQKVARLQNGKVVPRDTLQKCNKPQGREVIASQGFVNNCAIILLLFIVFDHGMRNTEVNLFYGFARFTDRSDLRSCNLKAQAFPLHFA